MLGFQSLVFSEYFLKLLSLPCSKLATDTLSLIKARYTFLYFSYTLFHPLPLNIICFHYGRIHYAFLCFRQICFPTVLLNIPLLWQDMLTYTKARYAFLVLTLQQDTLSYTAAQYACDWYAILHFSQMRFSPLPLNMLLMLGFDALTFTPTRHVFLHFC